MGQLLKADYSKVKIFVADNFFGIFAKFLEENMMDFSFMTSKQI